MDDSSDDGKYRGSRRHHRRHEGRDKAHKSRRRDIKDDMASHPYFQKKNTNQTDSTKPDAEGKESDLFWDGFQWVPR